MQSVQEGKDAAVSGATLANFTRSQWYQGALEFLSKGWVLLLAAVYGSGYIVVSIYHASLGLNEVSALRPKVTAAGLLFLALVSGRSI